MSDTSETSQSLIFDHLTIALPNDMKHSERLLVYNAVINAGFKSAELINSSTAAVLSVFQKKIHSFDPSIDQCISNVMVLDLKSD